VCNTFTWLGFVADKRLVGDLCPHGTAGDFARVPSDVRASGEGGPLLHPPSKRRSGEPLAPRLRAQHGWTLERVGAM
jgi:hypothetical protein